MQFLYLLDNRFDTDGDQKLTLKEIRPLITKGSEEGLKATFAELDFNWDRTISPEEFVEKLIDEHFSEKLPKTT